MKRGVLTVERTVSGGRVAPPKTSKVRHVKVSPALLKALQDHMEAMALDAQAGQWSPEARRLMFPTSQGNMLGYKYFVDHVWHPTLKAAKVVRRRFHSTRHSYAAWMLSSGADLRFVSDQLGHATPTLTLDTYGRHIQNSAHEHAVAGSTSTSLSKPATRPGEAQLPAKIRRIGVLRPGSPPDPFVETGSFGELAALRARRCPRSVAGITHRPTDARR